MNVTCKDGEPILITGSFGVCEWSAEMTTPGKFIDAADQAMYKAKSGGRDKVVTLDPKRRS